MYGYVKNNFVELLSKILIVIKSIHKEGKEIKQKLDSNANVMPQSVR